MQEDDQPSGVIAFPHDPVACSKTADHVLGDLFEQVTGYAFKQGNAGQVRLLPRRYRLISTNRGQPRLFGLAHTVNSEDKIPCVRHCIVIAESLDSAVVWFKGYRRAFFMS